MTLPLRDAILLTPGPLTTTLATKTAMLRDWGSWDGEFNALTADVCRRLLAIAEGDAAFACIPLQGSGSFAVEAAIGSLVPRDGKLLVLVNGAYGQRMARMATTIGRHCTTLDFGESKPVDPAWVARTLAEDPAVTQVGLVHCETSTGILNPLAEVAAAVAAAGRRLIVDAMSSFGALPIRVDAAPIDAVIASANKCLEGVPGMAFVIARRQALRAAEGQAHSLCLDLQDQLNTLERSGQWRYTPPTHVLAALQAALLQFDAEGGRAGRLGRYQRNCDRLLDGLRALGLRTYLPSAWQAPIIVTVHAPDDDRWHFGAFYAHCKAAGFILYPGKLTTAETFRIGCIGAIGDAEIDGALAALGRALAALGLPPPPTPPDA